MVKFKRAISNRKIERCFFPWKITIKKNRIVRCTRVACQYYGVMPMIICILTIPMSCFIFKWLSVYIHCILYNVSKAILLHNNFEANILIGSVTLWYLWDTHMHAHNHNKIAEAYVRDGMTSASTYYSATLVRKTHSIFFSIASNEK